MRGSRPRVVPRTRSLVEWHTAVQGWPDYLGVVLILRRIWRACSASSGGFEEAMRHHKWPATLVGVIATGLVAGCGVGPGRSTPTVSSPPTPRPVAARSIASYPPFAGRIYTCPPTRRTMASHRWHIQVTVCWYGSLHGAPVAFLGDQLGNPVWIWTKGDRSRVYRTGYPATIYQFSGNDVCLGSYVAAWAMAVNLETGQLINPLNGPQPARQWRATCAVANQAPSVISGVPGAGK